MTFAEIDESFIGLGKSHGENQLEFDAARFVANANSLTTAENSETWNFSIEEL
jgi:hypothetical protein